MHRSPHPSPTAASTTPSPLTRDEALARARALWGPMGWIESPPLRARFRVGTRLTSWSSALWVVKGEGGTRAAAFDAAQENR